MTAQAHTGTLYTSTWRDTLKPYAVGAGDVGVTGGVGLLVMHAVSLGSNNLFSYSSGHAASWAFGAAAAVGLAGLALTHNVPGKYNDRPLENNIGRGLTLATAATAGIVALAGFTANVPPAPPLAAAPAATFNVKAQDCPVTPVQKEIQNLAKAGFKVTCTP